jgi:hypothetical protein
MSFAVVRHPDIAALGIVPDAALDAHRANGWFRVSGWCDQPADLHLPDYAEVFDDLDAEPEPVKKPAKTTKETKA